ncbi:MAG: hypothetical protein H3C62_04830 [Gemmatimonadaceae bacterium]|nr:hypothetical protein [Gemmatimonadaceae bacterium]
MHLTVKQYDALEHAIAHGQRICAFRRGTEFVVIPERLVLRNRREAIEARHPTTGDHLTLWLDEVDALELVR